MPLFHKDSPTYVVWKSMRQRCLSPSYKAWADYGGRGITICDRWLGARGFENFLEDMGERPPNPKGWVEKFAYWTIDRRDNDGNYEPDNCRWATRAEQAVNKRPYRRPEVCRHGHRYAEVGAYIQPDGRRKCRVCTLANNAKSRNRKVGV